MRVAAPERLDDDQVRLAVVQRLPWIKRQREQLQAAQRQTDREMVTGESHYVWGSPPTAEGRRATRPCAHRGRRRSARCSTRPADTTAEQRRELPRSAGTDEQLREAIPALIETWEQKLGVAVPKWSIRRMKTKWGSCNRETGHIWFNVELAKKHPDCLEYIVVHEMAHLLRAQPRRALHQADGQVPA
ncbi:MAG: SprT-like domain-containing protein [Marmoricola sp.]